MAIIRKKPTSPGRRFVVDVSRPALHKGQPFAALVEKNRVLVGATTLGELLRAIVEVAMRKSIVLLTLSVKKMGLKRLLSDLSTILTALPILL